MTIPKNYSPMFDKPTSRKSKIAITITSRYISFSSGSLNALGYAPYVVICDDAKKPKTIFAFPSDENAPGAFRFFDKQKNKGIKIIRPQVAETLAETLGLDLKKGTWKIFGTMNDKDGCLVFSSEDAKLM